MQFPVNSETVSTIKIESEHRGFQLINSVKKEPEKSYLFLSIFISFFPYTKRILLL